MSDADPSIQADTIRLPIEPNLMERVSAAVSHRLMPASARAWTNSSAHTTAVTLDPTSAGGLDVQENPEVLTEPAAEVKRLEELFAELDGNGDGHIDAAEFQDLLFAAGMTMNKSEAELTFNKIDTEGAGAIDKAAFVAFIQHPQSLERMSVSAANANMLLLHAQLTSRLIRRRLETRSEDVETERQEDEPVHFNIEMKVGEPKWIEERTPRRTMLQRTLGQKKNRGTPAPRKRDMAPTQVKLDVNIFPDMKNNTVALEFKNEARFELRLQGRDGVSDSRYRL